MLRVNGKTIALATSCSLSTTTQTTDARTKDDASGPMAEFDYVDWNASSENLIGMNDGVTQQMLYDAMLELQLSGTIVDLSLELVQNYKGKVPATDWQRDEAALNNGFRPYGGKALIESVNVNAPNEGNATVSINFKAAGPLAPLSATQSA